MKSGPQINYINKSFTTRDSLGIENVSATISEDLCPVINNVTPRAFYWPFMLWIYYDYYEYNNPPRNFATFNAYVKRQDYFFVLATLLTPNSDQSGLVGKTQTEIDIATNKNGPYTYNPSYFLSKYGGMQYYGSGCVSLGFTVDTDPETGEKYPVAKLTQAGLSMAKKFKKKIETTTYYKEYRLENKPVPRDVLEEYGRYIHFNLDGFEECKALLRDHLFKTTRFFNLNQSAEYMNFLLDNYEIKEFNNQTYRYLLYDCFSPRSEKRNSYPENLKTIIDGWEIEIGRLYFTAGIGIIWKYMLEELTEPLSKKEWMEKCIHNSRFSFDLTEKLDDFLGKCILSYDERENLIYCGSRYNTPHENNIESGIKVALSVYNRFIGRDDIGEEKALLDYGGHNNSIPLTQLFDDVEKYKSHTMRDFIYMIMEDYIIDQHYFTAYEKLFRGNDGFFFDLVDDRYSWKHQFDFAFQGFRFASLKTVMDDLDMTNG